MRTIKELLILMKEEYSKTKNDTNITGLCSLLYPLYIKLTIEEYRILYNYINNHRPNVKHYYTHRDIPTPDSNQFWYKISDRLNRYKWLNKHIKLNS